MKRAVELAPLVNGTLSDVELCHADIVVEAIVEKRDAKQQLFARLEPLMGDDAILCSNTSTIPITQLADGLEAARAVLRPALLQPGAADAAGGSDSRPAKRATRRSPPPSPTPSTLGKSPIVMNDGPGFLVNRLLLPYMNEAALLLCEGAEHQGDRAGGQSRSACRWGRSRCTTWWASTWPCTPAARWLEAFPDRVVPAPIVRAAVRARPARPESRAAASSTTARRKAASRRAAPTATKSPS